MPSVVLPRSEYADTDDGAPRELVSPASTIDDDDTNSGPDVNETTETKAPVAVAVVADLAIGVDTAGDGDDDDDDDDGADEGGDDDINDNFLSATLLILTA